MHLTLKTGIPSCTRYNLEVVAALATPCSGYLEQGRHTKTSILMAFYGQCLVMAAWTNHSSGIFLNCDLLFDPTGTLKEEDTKLVQAASVKAKLPILLTDFFLLVQAASLEAKLAIFFTDFFLLLYVYCFSPTSVCSIFFYFLQPAFGRESLDQP